MFDDGAFCQHNVSIIIESNLSQFLYYVYHQDIALEYWFENFLNSSNYNANITH